MFLDEIISSFFNRPLAKRGPSLQSGQQPPSEQVWPSERKHLPSNVSTGTKILEQTASHSCLWWASQTRRPELGRVFGTVARRVFNRPQGSQDGDLGMGQSSDAHDIEPFVEPVSA